VLRHAPSKYSAAYRVNGDPAVDVPLTAEGEASCRAARAGLPLGSVVTCVSSAFARCRRTAELLIAGRTPVLVDARLNELDYGTFEGGEFLAYARWLAQHGPGRRPPEAAESQAEGIARMLSGLKTILDIPGSRLVVAHGAARIGAPMGTRASIPTTNRSLPARGAVPSAARPARSRVELAQPTAAT
jgi:2,3-bisphosphoglycerate-dependent phosphoglycerate mutase